MKHKFFIPATLAFISIIAGCEIIKIPGQKTEIPIRISTTLTKVSGDEFDHGDAIGLFAVNGMKDSGGNWTAGDLTMTGNHVDNGKYTFTGTWETTEEYLWKDAETQAVFYCYYPYTEQLGDNLEAIGFALPADQSTLESFKSAEILWGKTGLRKPTEERVNITLSHRTSQIVIEIVPGLGFTAETLASSITELTINSMQSNASLNLKDGSLMATGKTSDIIPYKDGNVWRAMIAPQKIIDSKLVTLTVDGRERSLVQTVDFTSNSIKKCTITVNKVNEGINVGIGGWEEDNNDYGGTLN
ncbi:MAG: fimbrillin family protein [Candidatus Cryptobacteroides sp.]